MVGGERRSVERRACMCGRSRRIKRDKKEVSSLSLAGRGKGRKAEFDVRFPPRVTMEAARTT